MAEQNDNQAVLTRGSVPATLARLTAPLVLGVLTVISISFADAYFIGKLGPEPLAAISFCFPIMLAVTSLAIGLGAGVSSVVARAIGENDRDSVRRLSTDGLVISVLIAIVIGVLGIIFARPLFTLLNADETTLPLAVSYMQIWFPGAILLVVPIVGNNIIRSGGDTLFPALIMGFVAVVNIALDPLLIFGAGPIPALGIQGAAWASVIARASSLVAALAILHYRERVIDWTMPPIGETLRNWSKIVQIGAPAAISNMINPLGLSVITGFLGLISQESVAAFGAATRVQALAAVPLLAMSGSISPYVGQNWGAGEKERVSKGIVTAASWILIYIAVMTVFLFALASPIAGLFTETDSIQTQAADYLRYVPWSLFGFGWLVVAVSACNARGKPLAGTAAAFVRMAVVAIPLAYFFATRDSVIGVYLSVAAGNVVGGLGGLYATRQAGLLRADGLPMVKAKAS
ncbi:MATE family efflux transporter [Parvularcula flava]|uniref:MATE family efflux transporter n=1 Tax=Aquisalinus luteolus TaxID=1566827 RepID=A0A8J3A3A5_9PROT|nr:MATE family efflux transporter [Aquisalinus luteolus]NHK27540.1 MATE family efflux transporter [Aquisalinus luteolus]GGH95745.1 MATE family efflux transporter [Aquisalinus luteolus]